MDANLLTPQEVASFLSISKGTVYEMVKRNELKGYKVGNKLRISFSDLEEYKNNNRRGGNLLEKEEGKVEARVPQNRKVIENVRYVDNKIIISGVDNVLDILAMFLNSKSRGVRTLRSYESDYNSLCSLYKGEVHAVAVNIWDGETDEYNVGYVKRMLPGISSGIINICYRMQGFYVKKGNPKNIKAWKDLARSDVKIVNREIGSGSRILLDEHIKKLGLKRELVNGYFETVITPMGVVNSILSGSADVGIGVENSFDENVGLEFIPIQKERYDLVVKADDLELFPFKDIQAALQSEEFKREMKYLKGYDFEEAGKIICIT